MVKSMTGYGRDSFHINGTIITVEIKSVNSRYLDFVPKIPRSLQDIELTLKRIIQTYFHRGRIEVYITITGDSLDNKQLHVDWGLLEQLMHQLKEIQTHYQLQEDIPLSLIANKEEIFTIQEHKKTHESLNHLLYTSVEAACKRVIESRTSEGEFLIQDIITRIQQIEERLVFIKEQQETIFHHYKNRIKERIEYYVQKTIDIDEVHVLQEIAILAEKGDIQEELTRLFSHMEHFKLVVSKEDEIGRKLDFIIQEMHREVNTIGAKSIDAQISEQIVMIKSDIEKVKEQLQNIE